MSVILSNSIGDGKQEIFCSVCRVSVGIVEPGELGAMSAAGVEVRCWEHGSDPDVIPLSLLKLDDTFLLGIDKQPFLCKWQDDNIEIEQESVRMIPITNSLWYSLKTGDISVLSIPTPLSSSPKLFSVVLEYGEENA